MGERNKCFESISKQEQLFTYHVYFLLFVGQMTSESLSITQTNSHGIFTEIACAHGSGRKLKSKLAQSLALAIFHQ